MKHTTLKNESLEIKINHHGAELCSIKNLKNQKDYLWNADPKFWARSSPILFPFVGSLKNKTYRYDGKEYQLGQHGFARDMDFKLIDCSEQEVWFELDSTEDTYALYPFHFHFEIGYRLEESSICIMWKVKNTDNKKLYFSIGAHPAFFCPIHSGDKQSDYYIGFGKKDGSVPEKFASTDLAQAGCVANTSTDYELADGLLPITEHLFDIDTLIRKTSRTLVTSVMS